ncbi:uncharacterized protein LOC126895412 [Daktulosphaira vitifoliae]|uniref:uncharacterized protein LOC126895412 n=1 Tax=Daktulosphaira vitifoliae TaxID=58002 RepID=UPI0021AA832E|nr:uncharacterized protein LOC126895412 [Daktulosphaira vitifoliae]
MDFEIKRNIESRNNILVASAISKLINVIKMKVKGNRTDMINIPEMLQLQEYCCHQNPIISKTALKALCDFISTSDYPPQLLVDWLAVLSSRTKCKTVFIQEIFELINLWLKNAQNYDIIIDTLVDILIEIMDANLNEWSVVQFHLWTTLNLCDLSVNSIAKKWLNATKRLFKFIFVSSAPVSYRSEFIKIFIKLLSYTSEYDLVFDIYSCVKMNSIDNILFLIKLLDDITCIIPLEFHETQYNLCLCWNEVMVALIQNGYEPSLILIKLETILKNCPYTVEYCLLTLARILNLCGQSYLHQIVNFGVKIILDYGCHKIISQAFIASILQWNQYKKFSIDYSDSVILSINSSFANKSKTYQTHHRSLIPHLTADTHIIITHNLVKLCSNFGDSLFISNWLAKIQKSKILLENSLFSLFLAGVYLSKLCNSTQHNTLLNILNKKYLLPLITYAIDRETNCHNRLDLINVIPFTACFQENIPLVINLIKQLEDYNEESLQMYSISMFYDLWKTESRCYRFLLYSLSKDKSGWQWNIVKSFTVQKLTKSNPNSDLVPIHKQMLTFYIKNKMFLPLQLTLESFIELCSAEYFSPEILLGLIDKNIINIHHPSIIASYCELLAECSNQTLDNEKRLNYLEKLWSLTLHSNVNTVKHALKSLCKIGIEYMSLKVLPKQFHDIQDIVTQLEDLEKLELFNGPIPGECWVKFLQNINEKCIEEAISMLSILLRQELNKTIRSRVPSDYEPKSLKHLPESSIARGLISYVVPRRKKMFNSDEVVKNYCLSVINRTDKPMYAFDWCFLETYISEGPQNKLWKESIILIVKQSITSTSAFRLLYKCYQFHEYFNTDEKKLLLNTLVKVSNIIYHEFQKQFIINVINDDKETNNIQSELLCYYLNNCKQILQNTEVHQDNKNFICNIFENIWCTIQLNNKKVLEVFLSCCHILPIQIVENMKPYPVHKDLVSKFIIMCCSQNIITSNESFDSLEQCIRASNQFSQTESFICNLIVEIFCLEHFVIYHNEFINNLMIYLVGFLKKSQTKESLDLMFSIFVSIIVSLSDFNCLSSTNDFKNKLIIFPSALVLFAKKSAQTSKIIEWLKTIKNVQNIPDLYSNLFKCCLAALKDDKYFNNWKNVQLCLLK